MNILIASFTAWKYDLVLLVSQIIAKKNDILNSTRMLKTRYHLDDLGELFAGTSSSEGANLSKEAVH